MAAPAPTPYRKVKEVKIDSALFGGYLIKSAAGLPVAAVPGVKDQPRQAEGTADLLVAGANHLPILLEEIGRVQNELYQGRDFMDLLNDLDDYLRDVEPVLNAAVGAGVPLADDARRRISGLRSEMHKHDHLIANCNRLIDAFDRARRDTP